MPNYAHEEEYTQAQIELWERICEHEGEVFRTVKGLEFVYRIRGNELFVDRKGKSVTRSTVNRAFERAIQLREGLIGPKMLGTFGASYLYPVFCRIGVIQPPNLPDLPDSEEKSGKSD